MKIFYLILFLISFYKLFSQETFSHLRLKYVMIHDGAYSAECDIYHKGNHLYLTENNLKDTIEIQYYKLESIIHFIEIYNQQLDSCTGGSIVGGDSYLDMIIDKKKYKLNDCEHNELDLAGFISFLKASDSKLMKETIEQHREEAEWAINESFKKKLNGCWYVSSNFSFQKNEVLILSKIENKDGCNWCFNNKPEFISIQLSSTCNNYNYILKDLFINNKSNSEDNYDNWNAKFIEVIDSNLINYQLRIHYKYISSDEKMGYTIEDYKGGVKLLLFNIISLKNDLIILKLSDIGGLLEIDN